MSLKKMLLPALFALIGLVARCANAQTMGEYATTTAGAASGGGSMGTSFATPPSFGPSDLGGSPRTWGASALGSSWSERAGAAAGAGLGSDFESRAGSATSAFGAESRWPGTGISGNSGSASRFDSASDRFSTEDRFTAHCFSPAGRWPTSSLSNHSGLDTSFNSISGN